MTAGSVVDRGGVKMYVSTPRGPTQPSTPRLPIGTGRTSMIERSTLKGVAERALDLLAEEHPLGHQASKARRYVLRTRSGTMELMIQRDPEAPTNIWMLQGRAAGLIGKSLKSTFSPASKLYQVRGSAGELNYGRHSALEKMPELGAADLVYFAPKDFTELGIILDYLAGL